MTNRDRNKYSHIRPSFSLLAFRTAKTDTTVDVELDPPCNLLFEEAAALVVMDF